MNQKEKTCQHPAIVCIAALVCCVLWGSAFPGIKIGYQLLHIAGEDTMSQMVFAGLRFATAGIIVIILGSCMQKKWIKPKKETFLLTIKLGCVQTIMQYSFFYTGIARTTGVKASIITASNVFFAILLSILILKEKMHLNKWIGCVLGFIGVVLINLGGNSLDLSFTFAGEGAMLVSAFAAALASVLVKGYSKKEDTFVLCGYQFLFGGIVLAGMGMLRGGEITTMTVPAALLFLYLAFVSAAAFTLWSILLKYNAVEKVAVYGFATPLAGVLLSALLLNEKNQAFTKTGCIALLLVSVGIWLVNRESKK